MVKVFHEVASVPVNSCILLDSVEEARSYPKGDITLGFCPECGFISNIAFNPALIEYSNRYEETQGFSSTFSDFHRTLAQRLIDRYDLYNKDIIEIGCGKGEFLNLLCTLGDNRGTGFDPAYVEGRNPAPNGGKVQFIQDFFSEQYVHYKGDFVCCKMTLEHIHDPGQFIRMTHRSIGDRMETIVFFQVPDVTRILRNCAFEDIYYEHCSYFSPGSLARLFKASGFDILKISKEYDDQYLTIEAKPSGGGRQVTMPIEDDLPELTRLVTEFPMRFEDVNQAWNNRLSVIKQQKKKIVLWGSGSKAVSFLTTVLASDAIEYVVDINPYRTGHFMAGTGQKIVSPDYLKTYLPHAIIIMNRVYLDEVKRALDVLGLEPDLLAL
jgi:Methyltransferase domain/C-methyltransferase C-terminal domain